MKKIFLFASLLLTAAPSFAAGAVVTQASGDAQIVRAESVQPAAKNAACSAGDKLVTAAGSQMDVALNGLAGCRLLASTRCAIRKTDASEMELAVEEGNVILNLQKLPPGSTFRLETPTAVAAVQGTQFWGRVLPTGEAPDATTFAVREGTVQVTVKDSGKTVTLEKGQALDITPGQLPEVRPALDAELQAMAQASEIATNI